MYLLIMKNQQLIGLFTSKKKMRETIEMLIKHSYEDTEFAHHYALQKEELLLDEDRQILYQQMKKQFISSF